MFSNPNSIMFIVNKFQFDYLLSKNHIYSIYNIVHLKFSELKMKDQRMDLENINIRAIEIDQIIVQFVFERSTGLLPKLDLRIEERHLTSDRRGLRTTMSETLLEASLTAEGLLSMTKPPGCVDGAVLAMDVAAGARALLGKLDFEAPVPVDDAEIVCSLSE